MYPDLVRTHKMYMRWLLLQYLNFLQWYKSISVQNLAIQILCSTSFQPLKLPPCRIPTHYSQEEEEQLREVQTEGIITESFSLWMPPMVFVKKKTGGVRLCVDYGQLSKQSHKDHAQMRCRIGWLVLKCFPHFISIADIGKYQLTKDDQYKTAFSPGPGWDCFSYAIWAVRCSKFVPAFHRQGFSRHSIS